ncbi:MAG: thioesterase domain-containing protein, partial [Blastocatellia bacterium]
RQVGHATVEEMAEFYIREMKEIQPEGPYYLGGSSFGGLAAYEMAKLLNRAGDEMAILALFDTGTPDYPKKLPTTTRFRSKVYGFMRRAEHHRDSLSLLNLNGKRDYFVFRLKKIQLKYYRKLNNTYRDMGRKFYRKYSGSIPKSFIQVEDKIERAGQEYKPHSYQGKITLFRAEKQPLGIHPDRTLGWDGKAAGGIDIYDVPGHHGSIVAEPYVRNLAEKLTDCLETAQKSNADNAYETVMVETTENEAQEAYAFRAP